MPNPFKSVKLRSFAGIFDTRSQPDETKADGFRLVLNSSIRGRNKRCRRGGWRRLFSGVNDPYNNSDLHDQLTGLQLYYDEFSIPISIDGTQTGVQYPFFFPSSITPETQTNIPYGIECGFAPDFFGVYNFRSFVDGEFTICEPYFEGHPYTLQPAFFDTLLGAYDPPCTTGYPDYWQTSYFELKLVQIDPGETVVGYGYGDPIPVYSTDLRYTYTYCGDELKTRSGCLEAITLLNHATSSEGARMLVAGTKSRLYALNEDTGNWKILADGLGGVVDEDEDCNNCSQTKFMSAVHENSVIFTNGFNPPLYWNMLSQPQGCDLWAAVEIDDLDTLNITAASVVGEWKGFIFFGDVVQDGIRHRDRIVWSDFNDPTSYVPSDDSLAGFQDLGIGETILRIEGLNDFMFIYTDLSIYRVALTAGSQDTDPVFFIEQIYKGEDSLKYKWSLVNTGDAHYYWSEDRLLQFTSFDKRPREIDWQRMVSNVVFDGIERDDISFGPLNQDACQHFVGGWNPQFKELWFSWPTDENVCPNMSLVFNLTNAQLGADLVDHGFTAFHWLSGRKAQTIAAFLEELEICTREALSADAVKEGPSNPATSEPFTDPPTYILNATEDPDLPADPDSVCSRIGAVSESELCGECESSDRFVMASATDFALKEYTDDNFNRERITGGSDYVLDGYTTVLESGADDFKTDLEKTISDFSVNFTAPVQTIPSTLELFIGFGSQPGCGRFKKERVIDRDGNVLEGMPIGCRSLTTGDEHDAAGSRADEQAKWFPHRAGIFLQWRLRIQGTGGSICFSSAYAMIGRCEEP